MTTGPEPGSNGFPLPPSVNPPGGPPASYGPPPAYGPPTYGHPPYGPPAPYQPHGLPGQYQQPDMRAAAADRERTSDVLKAAFMEGRLTKAEFDERSAMVLSARTYGELNRLVADLPAGPGGPAMPMPMPYQQGYYSPQLGPRTNGMAIGSLICAFFPFLGSILAVTLGHAARTKIRQTGERGDGLAITGLVLGYLGLSFWVLFFVTAVAMGNG